MRKSKRKKERKREREKIYHIITMMMKMKMMFFLREIYDRECTRQRKRCADGLSDFDFSFLFLPEIPDLASCDDYTYL